MSIVGPRPELADVVRTCEPRHYRRFQATPGLTGLWQVRATRKEPIHKHIGYDLKYLRLASPWMDLMIILETIAFVVLPRRDQI
jgi:lipopolysaccharide/colanic/teichoic acid biosynthesis glycosyltransferase